MPKASKASRSAPATQPAQPEKTTKRQASPNGGQGSGQARPLADNFIRVWAPTLITALFIITFNVQAFEIPSGSMEKTLLVGDHVLVDRTRFSPATSWAGPILPYRHPRDGDVVVFMSVITPDLHLVKRVIGVPGDRIHLVNQVVYRNGVALKEPYAEHTAGMQSPEIDNFPRLGVPQPCGPDCGATPQWASALSQYVQHGDLVVPPHHYFVMGDNREDSYDSRYWGFVPERNLIGRPLLIYWSYKAHEQDQTTISLSRRMRSFFSELIHFPFRSRWGRTLHLVR